jgi:RimJ/RimL family protein N-acetyltransferase
LIGDKSDLNINADETEIGYWIGAPYWGQGFIPEAVHCLMRHAFDDLGMAAVWCGYFDGNEKSKRVSEKCGFRLHHTENNKKCPLINETKTRHLTRATKISIPLATFVREAARRANKRRLH